MTIPFKMFQVFSSGLPFPSEGIPGSCSLPKAILHWFFWNEQWGYQLLTSGSTARHLAHWAIQPANRNKEHSFPGKLLTGILLLSVPFSPGRCVLTNKDKKLQYLSHQLRWEGMSWGFQQSCCNRDFVHNYTTCKFCEYKNLCWTYGSVITLLETTRCTWSTHLYLWWPNSCTRLTLEKAGAFHFYSHSS